MAYNFLRKIVFSVLLTGLPIVGRSASTLFRNGVTNYNIILCPGASASETTAATELADYLNQISGARFAVQSQPTKGHNYIYIGYDSFVGRTLGARQPADGDEGFRIVTRNGNLFIYGGRTRGTMYGVYRFLDEQLGVRWYAKDFVRVPKRKTFTLGNIDESQSPAFPYRCVLYYTSLHNIDWNGHNLVNSIMGTSGETKYGGYQGYVGVHTMTSFVSKDKYFKSHPEYFALRDGKRIDNGQLCLSNPNVVKLLIASTLDYIKQYPGCWCYSVSQDDNVLFCQCKKCTALEKKYGGHSGLLLWAVNQIADAVKAKYPDVMIGTLAYHATQTPPKNIVPRPNVKIRLCTVECCMSRPLTDKVNATFYNDLMGWKKLTNNLVIWAYPTNFYHYLMPFPAMDSEAENMRLYRKLNLQGCMEMGQYDAYGGEFFELKQWMFAKLLWNPSDNPDSLAHDFIYGFYGKAADNVMQYYNLTKQLGEKDLFYFETRYDTPFYTDDYLKTSRRLLDDALKKVKGNATIYSNVEKLRVSILYLQSMRNPAAAVADGDAALLKQFVNKYKWEEREGRSYTEFINKINGW